MSYATNPYLSKHGGDGVSLRLAAGSLLSSAMRADLSLTARLDEQCLMWSLQARWFFSKMDVDVSVDAICGGCMALSFRSPFSPAQPWARFFHPPDPPIALQSFTRDAPFSQASTLTLFFVLYPRMAETVSLCDWPQARAPHLLTVATSPWLAIPMFAVPFTRSAEWNEFRRRADGSVVWSSRGSEQEDTVPPSIPFLVCAFGEQSSHASRPAATSERGRPG